MPRVVVPTESEERAADYSHRRRRVLVFVLLFVAFLAAAAFGVREWRKRSQRLSPDTAFVSAPAWPKAEPRQPTAKAPQPNKEFLLVVGAYTDKRAAQALADRLEGLAWPVSVVVPVSATDSFNKVIVTGIAERAVARKVADSLGSALGRKVTVIEPMGTRAK